MNMTELAKNNANDNINDLALLLDTEIVDKVTLAKLRLKFETNALNLLKRHNQDIMQIIKDTK